MASNRCQLMDDFTKDFIDIVCFYKRKGMQKSDLKFCLEVFIADKLEADTVESANLQQPILQRMPCINQFHTFSHEAKKHAGRCNACGQSY